MGYLIVKGITAGVIVVGVSEIAKRSSLLAAVLASLPLTSILALIWLYLDSRNILAVRDLSTNIFWMVLPSLFFFVVFPLFLKLGFKFFPALVVACVAMSVVYFGYIKILERFRY